MRHCAGGFFLKVASRPELPVLGRVAPLVLSVPRLQCLRYVSGGRWLVRDPMETVVTGCFEGVKLNGSNIDRFGSNRNLYLLRLIGAAISLTASTSCFAGTGGMRV
jgi:hypothetical protein